MNLFARIFRGQKPPAQKSPTEEAAERCIWSLENDPDGWEFGEHRATCRDGTQIWTANRPYGDMEVGSARIGTDRQREQIRALMDRISLGRCFNPSQETKDVVELRRIEQLKP